MQGDDGKSHIQKAWELAEDPSRIKDYYQDWSAEYDDDVAAENYFGPKRMVEILDSYYKKIQIEPTLSNEHILDAGCGTGLVGTELQRLGCQKITGFDLSNDMVALADKKQCYQRLIGGVDLNQPLSAQIGTIDVGVIICVGVLTLGHVPPAGVERMLEVLPSKGILALNAREQYVREQDFEQYCHQLVANRKVVVKHSEYSFMIKGAECLYMILQKV